MSVVARPKRRLLVALTASTFAAAAVIGLVMPSGAQANTRYQTFEGDQLGFLCYSGCAAGGYGPVSPGTIVYAVTGGSTTQPSVGTWSRTFSAQCKYTVAGAGRRLRGQVLDRNWFGTWDVDKFRFTNGNDTSLPWCAGTAPGSKGGS